MRQAPKAKRHDHQGIRQGLRLRRGLLVHEANYSLPLNLSDLERISEVTGVSIGDIVMDSKRHAVEAAERKAQAGGYGLAAYNAAGKQEAINGEAGPDYDEPA